MADLGCGPGLLALLAWRAGAAKVYAIERDPEVAWLARRLVDSNGAQEVVEVVEGDARRVSLDQPVDLIVSETLGNFGIDEGTCETMAGFAQHHLKAGGRLIPECLDILLVPVTYRNECRGVWRQRNRGLDLSAAIDFPGPEMAQLYALRRRQQELAEPALLRRFDLARTLGAGDKGPFDGRMEVSRAGLLQGFVGYFRAQLTPDLNLSNYPGYPGANWLVWNWPVSPPQSLAVGQVLSFELNANHGVNCIDWRLTWQPGES